MNILIDADASPVTKETIAIAKQFNLHVYIVKSYAHFSLAKTDEYAETIYVDSEKDATDLVIIERSKQGDIVITQDYGLASICLGKGCIVIHHNGFLFTNKNIDRLLAVRHESAKARRAGKRTKGPRPYTERDKQKFMTLLTGIITANLSDD